MNRNEIDWNEGPQTSVKWSEMKWNTWNLMRHGSPVPWCYLWVDRCNDHEVHLPVPESASVWVLSEILFWTCSDVHSRLVCHPDMSSIVFEEVSPFLTPRFVEVLWVFSPYSTVQKHKHLRFCDGCETGNQWERAGGVIVLLFDPRGGVYSTKS